MIYSRFVISTDRRLRLASIEDREPWARAVPRLRWREPVLTRRDDLVVSAFRLLWLLTLANFGWWWFRSAHVVTVPRFVVTTAVLSVSLLVPWWLLASVRRMRRPPVDLPLPDLRVALIVTKSPGEPWPVVQTTIEGMQHQDHVGPYDVWLADEAPEPETLSWCHEHGVQVSSRADDPRYHRQNWPRRTRCKEGNLAYFYDHWGYDLYDVVVQFDADHVPRSDYLDAVLRCFADPEVGYVAAPSICDSNADASWSARGRLFREATLHGPVQAGQNDGMAPTCIGSHYAVRTQALRDVGGVGPELAEDFSTSFIMNVRGWKGAFALDAIAHGEGPVTFADAMVQELQWSRSLQLLMMRYCGPLWQDLPRRERWKLRFSLWWYPVFAAQMLLGFFLPIIAIATGTPWVNVSLLEFFTHSGVMSLTMIAFVAWLRSRQVLRPFDAKIISWESVLFQLGRWPWVLIGVLQGAAGAVFGRDFTFKVTPKERGGARDLPFLSVSPHLVLAVTAAAAVLLLPAAGAARGYYVLATAAAATYTAVSWAIPLLHLRENPALGVRPLARHLTAAAGATVLLACALVAGVARILDAGPVKTALDPTTVATQPTTLLWLAGIITVPIFIWRLGAARPSSTLLGTAAVRTPLLSVAAGGAHPTPVSSVGPVPVRPLKPAGGRMQPAALAMLAAVADASVPSTAVSVARLTQADSSGPQFRTLEALLESGLLAGDLGGHGRPGQVRLTPGGRQRLVLAHQELRDRAGRHEPLSPSVPTLGLDSVRRRAVFGIGRPSAPTFDAASGGS